VELRREAGGAAGIDTASVIIVAMLQAVIEWRDRRLRVLLRIVSEDGQRRRECSSRQRG